MPALRGETYFSDDTGKFVCVMFRFVQMEMYDDREDLYDEEDDQDSGAMNEDANCSRRRPFNVRLHDFVKR